jgi:hypothetical protein
MPLYLFHVHRDLSSNYISYAGKESFRGLKNLQFMFVGARLQVG